MKFQFKRLFDWRRLSDILIIILCFRHWFVGYVQGRGPCQREPPLVPLGVVREEEIISGERSGNRNCALMTCRCNHQPTLRWLLLYWKVLIIAHRWMWSSMYPFFTNCLYRSLYIWSTNSIFVNESFSLRRPFNQNSKQNWHRLSQV